MNVSSRFAVALSLWAAGAVAQNLYPNPDFDDGQGAAGWSADPGAVAFQTDDASGCPGSGSLVAESEELAPQVYELSADGPCLVFDAARTVDASLLYRGSSCATCNPVVAIFVYANDGCEGLPFDGIGAGFESVVDWTLLGRTFDVPAGGSIQVGAGAGGESITRIEIDEIRVTAPGYLFLDGFEGNGYCRWSSVGGKEP